MSTLRTFVVLGVACLCGRVPVAHAQTPAPIPLTLVREGLSSREYAPAPPQATLRLDEAVRLALMHSPAIAVRVQAVESAKGRLRATTGNFDSSVRVAPGVLFSQTPIQPFLRTQEELNREQLSLVADLFRDLNRSFRDLFDGTSTTPPPCPPNFAQITGLQPTTSFYDSNQLGTILDDRDPSEIALLGIDRDLFQQSRNDLFLLIRDIDLSAICGTSVGSRVDDFLLARYLQPIDFTGGMGLQGILITAAQTQRETFGLLSEISEAVAARARLGLERLGPVPEDQLARTLSLELGYNKPFRSGLNLDAALQLRSKEETYRDKTLDPGFGGLSIPIEFPSRLIGTATLPIGQGFGATGNAAAERAARITVAAEEDRLRHAMSSEVFRTVLAYLNAAAAQEVLRLQEASLSRQQELSGLTKQQLDAGDVAQVELTRIQARVAQVSAAVARARSDVRDAQLGLAETVGMDLPPGAPLPHAVEGLAAPADGDTAPAAGALLNDALAARFDLQATETQVRASRELTAGALADQRQRFDFSVSGGLSNRYESPFFRFFEDERQPIFSEITPREEFDSPARWYYPTGFWRSLSGRFEPFITANFRINFAIGNNAARGRVAQARATERLGRVRAQDLGRAVRGNLVNLTTSLSRDLDGLGRRRAAVSESEAALTGVLGQFKAGDVTVIDTLRTEETLTRDQLSLLQQTFTYLSTLARVRFEAGDLLGFSERGTPSESITFPTANRFVLRPPR